MRIFQKEIIWFLRDRFFKRRNIHLFRFIKNKKAGLYLAWLFRIINQLLLMHCISRINLVFTSFDKEYNWNTEKEHNSEVHKNINV